MFQTYFEFLSVFFDNFKFDILNEELRDSLTAYALTAKVVGEGSDGGVCGGVHT